MENHERVERELLEQCGQVAILMECFAWLRCDECIEQLEELCRAKLSAPRHWTQTIRWRGSRDLRVQSRNWSDVSCTLVASTRVATNDLLSGERSNAAFESRILTGTVINSNHIESRRFLEDAENALERVRDAVERHGRVKVNVAFNDEFATKDKRANKSIVTKKRDIPIHRFAHTSSTSSSLS